MAVKSRGKRKHRVVVVGAGFGGLACARRLAQAGVRVTVVDRRREHEFQPLLYQVATGALSPRAVRSRIRSLLPRQVRFVRDTVTSIDADAQRVVLSEDALRYDTLVLAPGARMEMPDAFPEALAMKTTADALELRQHLFTHFAMAFDERDTAAAQVLVVGGGPTGVELAGEIRRLAEEELAHSSLAPRVILVEQSDRLLPGFMRRSSVAAENMLDRLGVELRLESTVERKSLGHYTIRGTRGSVDVEAKTVVWAAGVRPSPLVSPLGETDETGRIFVDSQCRTKNDPDIYVIGDAARFQGDDETLPWVAAVAIQQGVYVGRSIEQRLHREQPRDFRYFDRGRLAHVGGRSAVGEVFGVPLRGLAPFFLAEAVHLAYLPRVENRLIAARDFIAAQLGRRPHPSTVSKRSSIAFDAPSTRSAPQPTFH